ncbi:aldo/keto reductase, partial [Streptomyces sp. NPDC048551]|uniref:aldo/keto reductase n=1 Tax=Streptomyces sp. NPDC048551 TaxID=3155758 RepID=UPI003444BE41
METVTLNNGVDMPVLGFGVYQIPPAETERAVADALAAGYRSLDTAAAYGNEEAVGRAIRSSGIPREDLFVTTKLWISDAGEEKAARAFETSLRKLGLDHLDLYDALHTSQTRADLVLDELADVAQTTVAEVV